MKQFILFISLIIILVGCRQNEEPAILQETGVVVNYAGAGYCSIVIELDNGQKIQPLYYPEGFEFIEGQRLLVSYSEMPNIVSTCGKGTVSEILNVEVLDCGLPITEPGNDDVDAFANDPVNVHEIALNDECLFLVVAYSGGCQNHEFKLIKVNDQDADEKTAVLELRHDANNDLCEAALSKELQFDLINLIENGYTKVKVKALQENGETFTEVLDLKP